MTRREEIKRDLMKLEAARRLAVPNDEYLIWLAEEIEKDEVREAENNMSSGSSGSYSGRKKKTNKKLSKKMEKKKPECIMMYNDSSQSEKDECPELDSLSNFLIQAEKIDLSTLSDDVNECSICSTKFDSIQLLFKHFHLHATHKKCRYCRKLIPIREFAHHFSNHKKLPCPGQSCRKSFKSQKKLREHMLSHEAEYRCYDCKQIFQTLEDFKRHEENVHEGMKKKFECTDCRDWFYEEITLLEHVKIHPVILKDR